VGRELAVRASFDAGIACETAAGSATRVVERHTQFSPVGEPWKRAFDVAMAVVALLLLMPLMLAAAVVIRLLTDGSLIVSERLIGHGGTTFFGYRFRLPVANPKTTRWANRVAESFRASSLDKLPQLFNVIRGDMSLTGPRPRAPAEFNDYFAQATVLVRKTGFDQHLAKLQPTSEQSADRNCARLPLCAQLVDRVRPRAPEQGHCCGS